MCDEWMPTIRLTMTTEEFHQLPRNGGFKYEYVGGQAYLSPRPRHFHALLDLEGLPREAGETCDAAVTITPATMDDFADLVMLFRAAFRTVQPFGSLNDDQRLEAARQALDRTRRGADGPWIQRASFVARLPDGNRPVGAILITLLPNADPCDEDGYYWNEPPPPNFIEQRVGRPHVTWIFVSPLIVGRGIGTMLLHGSAERLMAMGYQQLVSTFLLGNDSSMLWHWRNGFRLLPYSTSRRQLSKRWKQERTV